MIGQKFGRLTVLEEIKKYNGHDNRTYYKCVCECGNQKEVVSYSLKKGVTKSCGCLHKERAKQANITHGMKKTRFYKMWENMKNRCQNERRKDYKHYGGRGITLDSCWGESFEAFRDDMYGSYLQHVAEFGEKHTTLDRIDVNGNYTLDNCRWATLSEQALNRRKDSRNKTGVTGVYPRFGKWVAEISIEGMSKHLGIFSDFNDAVGARKSAELKYYGFVKEDI